MEVHSDGNSAPAHLLIGSVAQLKTPVAQKKPKRVNTTVIHISTGQFYRYGSCMGWRFPSNPDYAGRYAPDILLSNIKQVFWCFLGGYVFFETSLLAAPVMRVDDITIREGQNAYLESPIQISTGPEGKCIGFRYLFFLKYLSRKTLNSIR